MTGSGGERDGIIIEHRRAEDSALRELCLTARSSVQPAAFVAVLWRHDESPRFLPHLEMLDVLCDERDAKLIYEQIRVPVFKDRDCRQIEWSRGESNPRPLQCECSALPTELRPHRRESERSRAYSPTAPAGQPDSRGRAQGEPAPGTSTVAARIRAPRWARASARGIAVAARTKSVRRSTPPSMHAMT